LTSSPRTPTPKRACAGRARSEQVPAPASSGMGLVLSQQAGGIGTRGPVRLSSRSIGVGSCAASESSRSSFAISSRRAGPSARLESAELSGRCRSSATPTPASPPSSMCSQTRACSSRTSSSRLSIRDATSGSARWRVGAVLRHRRLRAQAAHQLVDAFHATLEVVGSSDLLVHVVDASAADPTAQIDAVHAVLTQIGAGEVPELLAFNKADLDRRKAGRLMAAHPGSVACSALNRQGSRRAVARRRRSAQDRGSPGGARGACCPR